MCVLLGRLEKRRVLFGDLIEQLVRLRGRRLRGRASFTPSARAGEAIRRFDYA
jgi:hypothetical protein